MIKKAYKEMSAIFFYVQNDRESQIAYKLLMTTEMEFKPFQIKGKNIANRLSQYGITKVPTLYFPRRKAKVEGAKNIQKLFRVPRKPLPERFHKAIREPSSEAEYLSEDSFEESSSEDSRDSLERSLEENPIESEEEEEESFESSEETLSDEISLTI